MCAGRESDRADLLRIDVPLGGVGARQAHRLLGVFEELRESSQLIVITHQRRTMEAADALYGITMRGDGVSAVISQQIASRQPA